MNNVNKAMFIFGFVFYFIGDLAMTYIGVSNGIPEKGFIRVIGSPGLVDMVIMKVIFFIALYFLIIFLEKRCNNYLCGDGDDNNVNECPGYYGVPMMKPSTS